MIDFNDAGPQMPRNGDVIPDGTFAQLKLHIRPGGLNGPAPLDAGLLTASKSSDAQMLDCEFTVISGLYVRRKFFQNLTVGGGKLDDKGQSKGWNISKATIRAMIDSALSLSPGDTSEAARRKRTLNGLKELDGIQFAARIMVEPAGDPKYSDKNVIANIITRDDSQFAAVMRGEDVPAEPVNAKAKPAAGAAAGAGQGGAAWATQPQQQQPAAWAGQPPANQTAANQQPPGPANGWGVAPAQAAQPQYQPTAQQPPQYQAPPQPANQAASAPAWLTGAHGA